MRKRGGPYRKARSSCYVLLEGTRLSGKTTAMAFLESVVSGITAVSFRAYHLPGGQRAPDSRCASRVRKLTDFCRSCQPHPVAVSRCHLYAYAVLQPRAVPRWFSDVDAVFLRRGFQLILFDIDEEHYLLRLKRREAAGGRISPIDRDLRYFRRERAQITKAFEMSRMPKYRLDTSVMSADDLMNWLYTYVVVPGRSRGSSVMLR